MTTIKEKNRVEWILHRLLKSQASLEDICSEARTQFAHQNLTLSELENIAVFFLYAGQSTSLIEFFIERLKAKQNIPWAIFVESLFISSPAISEHIKSALITGAKQQDQFSDLARTMMLDHFDETIPELRAKRSELFDRIRTEKRDLLLNQIELMKTQGLFEEEERLIRHFARAFPLDGSLESLRERSKKRKQLGLVQDTQKKRTTWVPLEKYQPVTDQDKEILQSIEKTMHEALQSNSAHVGELSKDFAIAQIMFGNEDASLRILEDCHDQMDLEWLKIEALYQSRKYILLLKELSTFETKWASIPEITTDVLYLRAMTYWELDEKTRAIEIMESIATTHPGYRNASGMLNVWKGHTT